MGWSHPDISLEDLLALIKGFVDILVLASGYQSSGLPATWDVENIKKAVRWGLFFEDVFKRLHDSVDYEGSVKELDAALLELTSSSFYPQGLARISAATLSKARDLVLEHLLQTNPLKDVHFIALLTAIIEMEISDLTKTHDDSSDVYIDRLMMQAESLNLITVEKGLIKNSITSSMTIDSRNHYGLKHKVCNSRSPRGSNINTSECMGDGHSCFIIQELLKRQAAMSCLSSVETGLDALLEIVIRNTLVGYENNTMEVKSHNGISLEKEKLTQLFRWNKWRSRSLSYLLDKRTIRLLSGASLIFTAPKVQWVQVFEQLTVSIDADNANLLEIIELSLLGSVSSKWGSLIQHCISHSCDLLPISRQYSYVNHLLRAKSQSLHSEREDINSKEKDILEYLTPLLATQPQKLWQIPPVLVATAVPSWSNLFRMYLSEIEKHLTGANSNIRCCDCSQDGKEHTDCEIAERIWCLYIFHIQGSHLMVDECSP